MSYVYELGFKENKTSKAEFAQAYDLLKSTR